MITHSTISNRLIADNIGYFACVLRKADMYVGSASVKDTIDTVLVAGIGTRDDFYWMFHSVFVICHKDHQTPR